jgi:hypothetical protein
MDLATALAREGCSVVINGLDPERLERAATEIREATGAKDGGSYQGPL